MNDIYKNLMILIKINKKATNKMTEKATKTVYCH